MKRSNAGCLALAGTLSIVGLFAGMAFGRDLPWQGTLLHKGDAAVPPGFTSLIRDEIAAQDMMQAGEATLLGLPLDADTLVDAVLTRIEVYAPGAQIIAADEHGDHAIPAPQVANFHGTIAGYEGSTIFLSVSPWWIYGHADIDGHSYIISTGPATDPRAPVIFNPENISADDLAIVIPQCQTDTTAMLKEAARRKPGSTDTRDSPCRVAKIAFDSDYELYQRFGNDAAKATAYIALVGAAMNDIYSRDVNTHIVISYSRVWTTVNDPWTKTNTGDQLTEFRAYWLSHMFQVSRNLAHFLSPRGLGGGVAWLSVVCNSQWGYAVSANLAGSFPYPLEDNRGVNWDPFVVAHELGHNFGSPHTHDYNPPVDTCGLGQCAGYLGNGTIMSYCHQCFNGVANIKLKFGDVVSNRILQYLTDEAICELGDLPKFSKQPASVTVPLGGTAKFTPAASGPGLLSFQWLHDNVPVPGATALSLTINNVTPADAGNYVLQVSNVCNTVFSNPATLTVQCPSDFDQSGFVDIEDFNAFVGAFIAGLLSADFDDSGFIDTEDYDAFIVAFESGC